MSGPVEPLIPDQLTLERLIEEHRLLREAIEHSPMPFAVYDPEDRLLAWNKAYEALYIKTGLPDGFPKGDITYRELVLAQLERQLPPEEIDAALKTRLDHHRMADGAAVERHYAHAGWFQVIKYRTPSGVTAGQGISIEALKEKEAELEAARDAAERERHAKADFLAHMSHELRTPMNGVLGVAELLMKTGLDDRQQALARTIISSGRNLLDVIHNVLELSRLDADALQLDPAALDPVEVVGEIVSLLSPQATQRGLTLEFGHAIPPGTRLLGDAGRIRQIVTNLIGNAIKFTDEGLVTVAIGLVEDADEDSPDLTIEVCDTGIGISPDKKDQIFGKFSQFGSKKRQQQGTGLGLSITKGLVDLMNGTIEVDSTPGEGSVFLCSIPLQRA